MKSNEERIKECLQRYENLLQSFVDKGELILSVRVTTKEQADELLAWLYSPEKPMKSELLEVSWDKALVPKKQAELLAQLIESRYD